MAFAGDIVLDVEAARDAVRVNVAEPLKSGVEEAAERIVRVGVANVVRAIRLVSVDKGHDPRHFSLLAYGGAGPLLAAEIAAALEMPKVIVPPNPGNFSALGLLLAPVKHEATISVLARLDGISAGSLVDLLSALEARALAMLQRDLPDATNPRVEKTASLRYVGQSYEIDLDLSADEPLEATAARFHEIHQARYGFCVAGGAVELVNLRVTASAGGIAVATAECVGRTSAPAPYARRAVFHDGRRQAWPIFRRQQLCAGATLSGPAIVEEDGATTVVPAGLVWRVDHNANLIIGHGEGGQKGKRANGEKVGLFPISPKRSSRRLAT